MTLVASFRFYASIVTFSSPFLHPFFSAWRYAKYRGKSVMNKCSIPAAVAIDLEIGFVWRNQWDPCHFVMLHGWRLIGYT